MIITPYSKNAKKHPKKQIEQVANSIREFGMNQPIVVDKQGVIIVGHGRFEALKHLGWSNDKILEHVKVLDISEEKANAYRLADNKLNESEWDMNLVIEELKGLSSEMLELTGFDRDLIIEPDEADDVVPDVPEEPQSKLGDLYELGNHRVLCGDSTKIEDVERLMDGKKADMVFTDPPYNIDYQGVKDKREKIKNDKMSDGDFVDFLTQSIVGCETMYVCCSWHYAHLFKQAMEAIGRKPKAMIVWNKVNPAQHLDKYFKQHEIIFYYGDFGGHKTLRGDVWTLKRQRNTVHPTMKPVELIEIALADQPDKKIVLDSFGGSGSTLIACEKIGRINRSMELDPKYIDVIVQRYVDYTGNDKIKKNGQEIIWQKN